MSLRFRKRFSLGKLLRVNLSTSGLSLSVGVPGASINFGRRGARTTLGIPGAGLSYSQSIGGHREPSQSVALPARSAAPLPLPPEGEKFKSPQEASIALDQLAQNIEQLRAQGASPADVKKLEDDLWVARAAVGIWKWCPWIK
jgi:hypothetical protein